jgi:hypothetical protein
MTVETEVNGDSRSTNDSCPTLVGSLGLSCLVKEIFVLPWLLYSAQYKTIFFLAVHYLNSLVPSAQQAEQAVVLGRLSLSMCLFWYIFSMRVLCLNLFRVNFIS